MSLIEPEERDNVFRADCTSGDSSRVEVEAETASDGDILYHITICSEPGEWETVYLSLNDARRLFLWLAKEVHQL